MNILLEPLNIKNEKTVIAIGFFDGVHIGHKSLINALNNYNNNTKKIVFSFTENPKNKNGNIKYLTGTEEKLKILDTLGCENIYFADFNEIKEVEPEEFAVNILKNKFNAECIITGYDFKFGKNREGDTALLKELCLKYNIKYKVLPPVWHNGIKISSTAIRQALVEGDVQKAEEMLGRPYSFTFTVLEGRKLGRTIGFPTINQAFPEYRIIPAKGVYSVRCELEGKRYKGIANIGVKPTITNLNIGGVQEVTCETHILGFDGILYGKNVEVCLKRRIRDEKVFNSLLELKEQIEKDIKEISDEKI